MRPEDIQFVPRPRPAPEAIDLGCVLVRRWWRSLQVAWLALAVPVALVLLSLPLSVGWKLGLFWWLKPLYEMAPLYLLSRRVFGEDPGLRAVIKAWPALAGKHALALLTWRRFNPYRSFDMPVAVLEGQRGRGYRSRIQVLHREDAGTAFWLLCIASNAEWLITLSIGIVLKVMVPQAIFGDLTVKMLFDNAPLVFMTTLAGMMLVAPFYVGCGFALYLNRRTNLEAWDLELLFRRIAGRLGRVAATCLLAIFCTGAFVHQSAYAADRSLTPASAQQSVKAVLAGPDFHDRVTVRTPVWPGWSRQEQTQGKGLNLLSAAWAKRLEYGVWALALAILVILLLQYRHWRMRLPSVGAQGVPEAAQVPTFLDKDADTSGPESEADRLKMLWSSGNQRAVIGALYRQFLLLLIERRGLVCRTGDTETDCLRRARAQNVDGAEFLADLTRQWLLVAYAHRPLPDATFNRLRAGWEAVQREMAVSAGVSA
ncbi:DUF4129 domain-containing protein [Mangrovitalea sediminis]|uniref:DUF4129 domain-containing protein n=1 Tax=Mangrovitalea sediminis TaxID=1982043 RepID=UPI000BE5E177|nr:DUF4129 domain-containing protein [Mangrovitalea sediminis]